MYLSVGAFFANPLRRNTSRRRLEMRLFILKAGSALILFFVPADLWTLLLHLLLQNF